jgi:hypothetical protein
MKPNSCPIRSDQFGSRCTRCKAQWDRDDEAPLCPRQVATRAHDESRARSNAFVSGLAPYPFPSR